MSRGRRSHCRGGRRNSENEIWISGFRAQHSEHFRCALTELDVDVDVDVIPRSLYWNPKTREDSAKINPYMNGCPPEILEKQAKTYREAMGAVMANIKHIDRVSFWGFGDGHSWLNNWPWKRVNHDLLFDRESKPKPAFHAVAEMLKKGGWNNTADAPIIFPSIQLKESAGMNRICKPSSKNDVNGPWIVRNPAIENRSRLLTPDP